MAHPDRSSLQEGWSRPREVGRPGAVRRNFKETGMAHAPIKYVEKGLSYVAGGLWHGYALASRLMQKESFTPTWSDKPLQKSW
jgi:hypothetical protein